MLDNESQEVTDAASAPADSPTEAVPTRRRRRAASRPAGPPTAPETTEVTADAGSGQPEPTATVDEPPAAPRRRTRKRASAETVEPVAVSTPTDSPVVAAPVPVAEESEDEALVETGVQAAPETGQVFVAPLFQAPLFQEPTQAEPRRSRVRGEKSEKSERRAERDGHRAEAGPDAEQLTDADETVEDAEYGDDAEYAEDAEDTEETGRSSRRRRRGGRRRRRGGGADEGFDGLDASEEDGEQAETAAAGNGPEETDDDAGSDGSSTRRRRRRRRRGGSDATEPDPDDPPNTVVKIREPRRSRASSSDDEVQSVRGSTRLEAKKQRRREGREQGRRRPPIITEAEFLARREAVERVMVVRQTASRTQIGVLEDGVLVEHYVSQDAHTSLAGNVYLGKVQNVLPSMEAAFVDIGKGRNAVLYAGEVNFDVAGMAGQPKRIESVLKSGQSVLVQVTKDPLGHKGARLTSQVSLPGRYLVYVPEGSMTGISRKLPDTERSRLKQILKKVVPENAGVIVRTAAEGAAEKELSRDVTRLAAQWEDIRRKSTSVSAPSLLYGEPDMTVRVIRDIFNEDFSKLVVSGDEAWNTIEQYVSHVAPDLAERLERWSAESDVFAEYRIDEQLTKALDRKVWLPSGGSLIIERTEAMTVIDVNTGKFTGKGGNLEETVTKNNIEAAEEIVRQLRLRDLGGIIVIDFIDMVLENNRDLVLRRLLECLGRDRTKHQVAEVTSLGLVQMTRKRVGQGLLESFSDTCEPCNGRGVIVRTDQVESSGKSRKRKSGGGGEASRGAAVPVPDAPETPVEQPASTVTAAVTEPDPAPKPVTEPAAESPQPARTRTRRRASRAAGSPRPTEATETVEPPSSGPADPAEQPTAQPVAERPADPPVDSLAEDVQPEPAKVTAAAPTRTRRAARRPAGPVTVAERPAAAS